LAIQIQIRRDTAANWTSVNPTLAQGEIGHETDTNKTKIGNGVNNWNTLSYWVGTPVVLEWGNITGSIEDQADLVNYISQNYISITHAELLSLINNNELLPNWWYKITDYQTNQFVRGSNKKTIYTGEIEPIFVKAISTNKITNIGISALYTNEIITYSSTVEDLNMSYNSSFDNDGSGTIDEYGDFSVSPHSANIINIDSDFLTYPEKINSISIYYEDNEEGTYGQIGNNERNKTYAWDEVNKRITLLGFTEHWAEYEDGSIGDEDLTVISSSKFTLTNLTTEPYTASLYDESLQVSDYDNGTYFSYTWADYGTTWEISASGEITLLNTVEENIDLTNSCYIYWVWKKCDLSPRTDIDLLNNQCYFQISAQVKEAVTKGIVLARNNAKRKAYIQDDYRGCKYRRHKVKCDNWASRTWTKGEVCRYSGYIWLCISSTPATPSVSNYGWCRVVIDDYNITSNFFTSGFFIEKDEDNYQDVFMTDLTVYDDESNNTVLNIDIKRNLNNELDIVFSNSIMGSQNSELIVGGTSGGATIRQYIKESKVSGSPFFAEYFIGSEIKKISSMSYLGTFNSVKADNISSAIIPSHNTGTHSTINGVISCRTGTNDFLNVKSDTFETSLIFNTFKNSTLGSVVGAEFQNEVDNATLPKINGATVFKNKITGSQLWGEVRNTTFNSQVLRVQVFGDIYGISSSALQTLPYMANVFVFGNITLNNITSANIVNSICMGFSNCTMTASSTNSRIDGVFSLKALENLNDNGKGLRIIGCKFFDFVRDIQNMSSGSYRILFENIIAYGKFGEYSNGIYCNANGTSIQEIKNTVFKGNVTKIYFKRGNFINNETEDMNNINIGSASYNATIENSKFGKAFNNNTIGANNTTNLNNVKFGDNIASKNIDGNASNSVYDDAFPDTNITLKSNFKNTNNLSYLYKIYSNETTIMNIKQKVHILNGSVGATTARLPIADGSGTVFVVKAIDITNTCTLDATTNSGSIDGGGNYVFSTTNEHITICDIGTNTWAII